VASGQAGYAVWCQISDEWGAVAGYVAGSSHPTVKPIGTLVCPGREEVRRMSPGDSPYPGTKTTSLESNSGIVAII
jgi:hypothetical protein